MSTFAPAPYTPPAPERPEHANSETASAPDSVASAESFRLHFETLPGSSFRLRDIPVSAWLLLLLTANLSVAWSNARLLSQDEIFVLQTDSVSTLGRLLEVQRHAPISLDPLFYHLLGFCSLRVFHAHSPAAQAYALRFPSLLGFLLLQLCLFLFVRRTLLHAAPRNRQWQIALGARRAGLVALMLPALTATFIRSAEARPYGLLLGLCGVILVSWQAAVRQHPHGAESFTGGSGRAGSLTLLALSIGLALNTHYFAVLLLLPLGAAELQRFRSRGEIDWPMLAALAAGCAGFFLTLPFAPAAGEFRTHYYNVNSVGPHVITQAYRSLLLDYTEFSWRAQQVLAGALLLGAAVVAAALVRKLLIEPGLRAAPETTFLLALAALPVAGFAVGRFATHTFEVRYVVCALPALCALLALLLAGPLADRLFSRLIFAATAAGLVLACVWQIHTERDRRNAYLASSVLSPAVAEELTLTPDHRIYIQNVGAFEAARLYGLGMAPSGPNGDVEEGPRPALVLLYSRDAELRWDGHDTASLTAMHLQRFTTVPTVSWDQLASSAGPHLLVLYHSGWDWTDQALAERAAKAGLRVTPVGPAFGGDAVLIQ